VITVDGDGETTTTEENADDAPLPGDADGD